MEQRTELQKLAGDVLGVTPSEVPLQLVCPCRRTDLARAITLRNAVDVLMRYVNGDKVRRADAPWHLQYLGRHTALVAELRRTGYLNPTVN